jgi:hypothetical protein
LYVAAMEIPEPLKRRIDDWEAMSRWERSELGRDLRRLGLSYGEIRQHIDVIKSTLATWCRDIVLTDKQKAAIRVRTGSRAGIPVDTNWRRRLEIEEIRQKAGCQVRDLVQAPLWIAGVILYWGEGNKTGASLGLSNADPRALRLFIEWSRVYHDPAAEFTLKLNLHAGNDEPAARRWWIASLGLTDPTVHRTFIKPDGTGHRKNHLPNGGCLIRMRRSADAFHRTLAWIDALSEHFLLDAMPRRLTVGR